MDKGSIVVLVSKKICLYLTNQFENFGDKIWLYNKNI